MSSESKDIGCYSSLIIRDCDSDDDAPEEWATSSISHKQISRDFSKIKYHDENSIIITCCLINETSPQVPIEFSKTGNKFISYLIDNYGVDEYQYDSLIQIIENLICLFEEQHDITNSTYKRDNLYNCVFPDEDEDAFDRKRYSVYRFSSDSQNYCLLFSLNYSSIQINSETSFNF